MFNALLGLFQAANIIGLVLLVISYVLTVVAKVRKSELSTSTIAFPTFTDMHSVIKSCYWSGTLFVFLNWLLCSSYAIEVGGKHVGNISDALLTFGIVWAVTIFVGAVCELVIKCIRTKGTVRYSVSAGIKSSVWYAVLYLVLSFLTA